MDAPVLEITPAQSDQREQQQNAERRRGQLKRSPRDGELERERSRRGEVPSKSTRHNLVSTGLQLLHRELRIVRDFLPDNFAGTVKERECILKLLGERAAADRRDVQQQTILRIIQSQARTQFIRLMYSLADDARRLYCRRDESRFVAHHAAIGAGDDTLAAVGGAFGQHCKDALRRQTLLNIQTRNDRSELIVERDSQQAVA